MHEVVVASTFTETPVKYTPVTRIVNALNLDSSRLQTFIPKGASSTDLMETESIGKVRIRATVDGKNEAVAGTAFQVVAELAQGGEAVLSQGTTTADGYASVNLVDVPRQAISKLKVTFPAVPDKGAQGNLPLTFDIIKSQFRHSP